MALGIAKLKLFRVWRSSDAAVAPTPYYTIGSGKVNDFFAGGILRGLGPAHETG